MTPLQLQTCANCGHVQYPNRELCAKCLSDDIAATAADNRGRLISWTAIHASLDAYFQTRAPWRVGVVALDCGPILITHLADNVDTESRVEISAVPGPEGYSVWVAYPDGGDVPADPFTARDTEEQ